MHNNIRNNDDVRKIFSNNTLKQKNIYDCRLSIYQMVPNKSRRQIDQIEVGITR